MGRTKKLLRKTIIALIGFPLFIGGLIITPLPFPPGWPFCLAGLVILSYEFEWARKRREQITTWLKKLWQDFKVKKAEIDKKYKD